MDLLPDELLLTIIEFLQPIDVFLLMRVSSTWNRLVRSSSVWSQRLWIDFPDLSPSFLQIVQPYCSKIYQEIAASPVIMLPIYCWEHEAQYDIARRELGDIPVDMYTSFSDIFNAVEEIYYNSHPCFNTVIIVINLSKNYQRTYRHIILARSVHNNIKTTYIDIPVQLVFSYLDHVSIMYN